jgi:staphylococcal nuclease domain-containing protein 1
LQIFDHWTPASALFLAKRMTHDSGAPSFLNISIAPQLVAHLFVFGSFVKLLGAESEYHAEAIDRFRTLCEGRKLVANIDHKEGSLMHLRLMDPSDPAAQHDPLACINADLLRDGLAAIDRKTCKYLPVYPQVMKKLQEAVAEAKRERQGMFEFGDVEEDE